MFPNNYKQIALDIKNNLPDDKPYHIVENFFSNCMPGFDEQKMIKHFTKLSSRIFNPDSKRLIYFLSAEDLHKKKYEMFTNMHNEVIALTEEMDKGLIVSAPSIVVNEPKCLEQDPHYDYNKDESPLDSKGSFSIFAVTCKSTKLIAWINGTFNYLLCHTCIYIKYQSLA
jgi:hypothetical protein